MAIDQEFLQELASKAPTPGGGGASAYCGALAAALGSMVGNLTIGKKTYAAVEPQIKQALSNLEVLRKELVSLIDKDAKVFEPLAAAYKMPHETPVEQQLKHAALQEALTDATEVPLEIMNACAQVIAECDVLAHCGSRLAISDAGVAVLFASAALKGASLTVYINAGSMDNKEQAQTYIRKADWLIVEYETLANKIYTYVSKEIR